MRNLIVLRHEKGCLPIKILVDGQSIGKASEFDTLYTEISESSHTIGLPLVLRKFPDIPAGTNDVVSVLYRKGIATSVFEHFDYSALDRFSREMEDRCVELFETDPWLEEMATARNNLLGGLKLSITDKHIFIHYDKDTNGQSTLKMLLDRDRSNEFEIVFTEESIIPEAMSNPVCQEHVASRICNAIVSRTKYRRHDKYNVLTL